MRLEKSLARPTRRLTLVTVVVWLMLLFPAPGQWANAANLQCEYLPDLFQAFLKGHYSQRSITDDVKNHTVEQLVKSVDPSKTLFLEEDVLKIRKNLPNVFSTMKNGECGALNEAYDTMISRAKENETFVRGFLGKGYKFDENTELMLDPEKRSYPKTAAEKQDILRKMVHFQISSYLLTDMKLAEAKKQLTHRYELVTKRLIERKKEGLFNTYAEAFAAALDPHSSYLSQDNLEDFQIQMQLSLEGIGASLTSIDGFTVIEDTIPGGAAEKTNSLKPKDKIIAVGQEGHKPVSVIDMDLRDVVKLIRGKKGTKVTLTILRQADKTETFDVAITRDKIDIKEQAAKITYENRKLGEKSFKIGVIDLPSFYGGGGSGSRSCSADVKKLLEEAKAQKVEGIVLNLTRNGGGLLDEAVKISGFFLKKGAVVATKDSDKNVQILSDDDDAVVYAGPLVVLTSRLSASASEILAGALKDYKRAVVVGSDHTFGKGTVQVMSGLPLKLGAMKVTAGMFFLPGGKSTQHMGVPSDIILPPLFNSDEVGEKILDYSLAPQSINTFTSNDANSAEAPVKWKPIDDALVKQLTNKSVERVKKDAKFAEIKKELDEASKTRGLVKLADLRKKTEAKTKGKPKKEETKRERDKKVKEMEAPYVQEGLNILVDMLSLS